jgi:hypothetical protein
VYSCSEKKIGAGFDMSDQTIPLSVDMLGNEPANTETSEAVFLGGLSLEQPLSHNPCALLVYILILSWQDMSTNTEDNKFQSVQPCILVWQSFSSIRKQKVMLTCLQIMRNCLTHMWLLQGAPTSASTQCGMPITISHMSKEWPFSNKCQHFHGQGMLHDILGGD